MSAYWKYATVRIPAGTTVLPLGEPRIAFPYPITVRAKIPAHKNGRPFGKYVGWSFRYRNQRYLLEQAQEFNVSISNIRIRRVVQNVH